MDGRRALSEAFSSWVEENGWSQTDVVKMGGPSTTTQTKIVLQDGGLSKKTLQQIDTVMGWGKGTSAKVIAEAIEPPEPRMKNSQEHGQLTFGDLLGLPSVLGDLSQRIEKLEGRVRQLEAAQQPTAKLDPSDYTLAARRGRSIGKQMRSSDEDVNQDPGGMEPA